jgi:hypothetical protein
VRITVLVLAMQLVAAASFGQGLNAEVSATAGVSTDEVAAAATQARLFGELRGTSIFAEAAWARSATGDGRSSEAFSTAYPYAGPPHVMDAYLERRLGAGQVFGSVRAGRFRTPFGIYAASEHAYNGFLRAPLIRYEGYWSITNTLLEHGVNLMAGTSRLQGEVTFGHPADVSDDFSRRSGMDVVLRAQSYVGPFVIGVSHLRSETYDLPYAAGAMQFTGVDLRWMSHGVQVRGEWLTGRPWNDTHTRGGYVDVSLHRPFMGPVTLVTRLENLDYDTPDPVYADEASGVALGTRVRLVEGFYAQVNVTHRPSEPYGQNHTATDVALTYTLRYRR